MGIITYLFLITLRSYVYSKLKWYMDLKYISENKLLMIYGILGTFLCCIVCTITTFVKCEETKNNKSFYDYICLVSDTDNKYFDSFSIYFSNFELKKLKSIFLPFFFFGNKYCSILIIKFFTPVHLILSFPVYYICQKIIHIISTLIQNETTTSIFNEGTKFNFRIEKFTLDFLGDIFSLIGFVIYLEFLELNFCKLNYNLRRNIINRAIKDIDKIFLNEEKILLDEEESRNESESYDNISLIQKNNLDII